MPVQQSEPMPEAPDPQRMLDLGIDREGRGDLRGAVDAYMAVDRSSDLSHQAAYRRAKVLQRLGLDGDAVSAFNDAIIGGLTASESGRDFALRAEMELAAMMLGSNLPEAERLYREVADSGDPAWSSQASLELGRLYLSQNDPRQAEDALRLAADGADPTTRGTAIVLQGDAFRIQGQFEEAHDAYLRAFQEESPEVRELAAAALRSAGFPVPGEEAPSPPQVDTSSVSANVERALGSSTETGPSTPDQPPPATDEPPATTDEPPQQAKRRTTRSTKTRARAPDVKQAASPPPVVPAPDEAPQPEPPPSVPAQDLVSPVERDPPRLIGRGDVLQHITALLTVRPDPTRPAPMVVLVGLAGTGKGTLASHAALAAAGRFRDGAWVLRVPDASAVPGAQAGVVAALDKSNEPIGPDPASAYQLALKEKSALLILEGPRDPSVVASLRPPNGASAMLVTTEFPLTIGDAEQIVLSPLTNEEILGFMHEQAAAGSETIDRASEALILELGGALGAIGLLGDLLRSFTFQRSYDAFRAVADHLGEAGRGDLDPPELSTRYDALGALSQRDLLVLALIVPTPFAIETAAMALGERVGTSLSRLRSLVDEGFLDTGPNGTYSLPPAVLGLAVRRMDAATGPVETAVLHATRRVLHWLASIGASSRRSGYVSDMVRTGKALQDHLDMQREVDALSWVVTSDDVSPPLSIGLFGVWGSGKSTFMELMQQKIRSISSHALNEHNANRHYPACGNVRQITFNAWHYADANLWASLVTHIFEELAKPEDGPEEGRARKEYENLLERLETSQSLRREAEQKLDMASRERLQRTEELADVKHERIEAVRQADQGNVSARALAPTEDLQRRATEVRAKLDAAGAPLAKPSISMDEIREGIEGLISDPELLRRAVAAIDDEPTRLRLDALLVEPRVRDLLVSAGNRTTTRDQLVAVLTDQSVASDAKELIPDDRTRTEVHDLGIALTDAYRQVLELRAVTNDMRSLWGKLRHLWRQGSRHTRQMIVLGAAGATILGVVAAVFVALAVVLPGINVAAVAAAVVSLVSAVAVVVAAVRKPLNQVNAAVDIAVDAVDRKARRRIEQLTAQEAELQKEIDGARREEHEAQREIEDIRRGRRLQSYIEERASASDYRSQLGIVAQVRKDFTRLAELMQDARIYRNLPMAPLTAQEKERKAEVADLPSIDRVILYIDDLDRCPTDRVVQVLEAVHLLLALPLFVVVVGVDSRWLMQSLRQHYTAQLRGSGDRPATAVEDRTYWESTPQNYLEKIFQIPFSIRGMNRSGYVSLIDEMFMPPRPGVHSAPPSAGDPSATAQTGPPPVLETDATPVTAATTATVPSTPASEAKTDSEAGATPADQAAGGALPLEDPVTVTPSQGSAPPSGEHPDATEAPPEALSISKEELDFLHALVEFVPTPRAARRLANTYRLVRVLLTPSEYARYGAQSDEHYKIVLTLLGILVGFPEQATIVFQELIDSDLADWSMFTQEVIDKKGYPSADGGEAAVDPDPGKDRNGKAHPDVEPSGRRSTTTMVPASAASHRDPAWEHLSEALQQLAETEEMPSNLAAYRTWAGQVSRYSFHTGQLAAAVAEEDAA